MLPVSRDLQPKPVVVKERTTLLLPPPPLALKKATWKSRSSIGFGGPTSLEMLKVKKKIVVLLMLLTQLHEKVS
jgi:hypothetical protein